MRVAPDCCDYEEASGNADQVVSTSDRKPSACSPGHRDHVVTCPDYTSCLYLHVYLHISTYLLATGYDGYMEFASAYLLSHG